MSFNVFYPVFRYIPVPVSGDLLYLGIAATFVLVKLADLLADPVDPYRPLQAAVRLLTGDLWDRSRGTKED